MKKILFAFVFLMGIALFANADEQNKVKLSKEYSRAYIRFSLCHIVATLENKNSEGENIIRVDLENVYDPHSLILFEHAYGEKSLKKISPRMYLDKSIPGTRGKREIEPCKIIKNNKFIQASKTDFLANVYIKDGETKTFRLPIYIAKYKNKRRTKVLLLEKKVLELVLEIEKEIKVDSVKDPIIIRLDSTINALKVDISKQTFCNNSLHRPTLKQQEAEFKERISQLETEINNYINRFYSSNTEKPYQDLLYKLNSIDFSLYEKDCGKHVIPSDPGNTCRYCNMESLEIYHRMEGLYKKLHQSNNKKATKDEIMPDVNLLYSCPKHSQKWRNSKYKKGIEKYYKGIVNYKL